MEHLTAAECAEFLREGRVAVLSGAGVSTAAGIPDFRGPQGLYKTRKYDPDTIFDIRYFARNPQPFFDFSRDFLSVLETIKPTFTHSFLSDLESRGLLDTIITQNIDPLHQQAGSKKMICLHGNYFTAHCCECGRSCELDDFLNKLHTQDIPACDECRGVLKPDVVFFGETVYGIEEAVEIVQNSKTLLVLGSSLAVYPAALLPEVAGRVVVVNQGAVNLAPSANRFHVEDDLDKFFREVSECMMPRESL